MEDTRIVQRRKGAQRRHEKLTGLLEGKHVSVAFKEILKGYAFGIFAYAVSRSVCFENVINRNEGGKLSHSSKVSRKGKKLTQVGVVGSLELGLHVNGKGVDLAVDHFGGKKFADVYGSLKSVVPAHICGAFSIV